MLPAKPATITYLDNATYARLRNQGWAGLPSQRRQRYLQNRVSYSYLDEDGDDNTLSDRHYTYYSYDAHGNVEWLVQDVPGLGVSTRGKKHLRYAYDLLSGNVRQVYYQEGQPDAFYHRYAYDADNRLLAVETSTNAYHWEQDARYDYYAHGPLRRVELGHDQVQGLDYTYTIHGWLKAINHPVLNPNADPGADGPNGTGQDAFGMSLGYYQGDYKNNQARYQSLSANSDALIDRNLYNGNIAAWASDGQENQLAAQQGNLKYTGLTGQQYQYDELNRLVGSTFRQYQNGSWQSPASAGEYGSTYSYDASGNLQTLNRSAFGSNPLIDRLQYHYQAGTNKLDYVTDAAGHPTIRDDFQPGQQAGNYAYDAIGNLTKDEQEGITSIAWTVYGKVQQVSKQDGSETTYSYDASGNRSSKQHVNAEGQQETTYYVRDASGNVMAIYQASGEERCLIGEVRATKRYDPSAWEDGELALGQVKEVYLPQEIQVTAGSSGNHELTLYYTDAQGVEQTVLYRGGASVSHAYNKAGTTRNETQYQQGQRYVFQSSTNGVVADELIQVQSMRVSINNGDSWDPSGQTSVMVKLYEPCAGLTLAEQPIYGSERLGMYRPDKLLSQEPDEVTATGNVAYITGDISISAYENVNKYVLAEGVTMTVGGEFSFSYAEQQQEFSIAFGDIETQGQYYARETGKKQYELKDHLGNVRVLVSDKKLSEDTDGDGVGDVSKAEVLASYEYYAFGMLQPGRTFQGSADYRFGFNGKEKDNSFGATNYDYGFRIYNPQIGKFLSVDPLTKEYPWYTPYQFAGNSPVYNIDVDGLENSGYFWGELQKLIFGTGPNMKVSGTAQKLERQAQARRAASERKEFNTFRQHLASEANNFTSVSVQPDALTVSENSFVRNKVMSIPSSHVEVAENNLGKSSNILPLIVDGSVGSLGILAEGSNNKPSSQVRIPTGTEGFVLTGLKAGEGGRINLNSVKYKSSNSTAFRFKASSAGGSSSLLSGAKNAVAVAGYGLAIYNAANNTKLYEAGEIDSWQLVLRQTAVGAGLIPMAGPVLGTGGIMAEEGIKLSGQAIGSMDYSLTTRPVGFFNWINRTNGGFSK